MTSPRTELRKKARRWDEIGHIGGPNREDLESFSAAVDALLSLGDLRYQQYEPHSNSEKPFSTILSLWIENLANEELQKQLVRLARTILFVDLEHLKALYRDAFSLVVLPKLYEVLGLSVTAALDSTSDEDLRAALATVTFATLTTSGNFELFRGVNGIRGFQRSLVVGEDPEAARRLVKEGHHFKSARRLVVLEDFVGSGDQASRVLSAMAAELPPTLEFFVFIPILILESAFSAFSHLKGIEISPISCISSLRCIAPTERQGEPPHHREFRHLINMTSNRVMRAKDPLDDQPTGPYGYNDSGALVVTLRNTPNNTLPLIYHEGKTWRALFRRLHHAKREKRRRK